ncbi:MAG TPA: hypothetical protein ENK94_00195 [Campylobacterales bacterium]|nr:hypothetical protein [Campylobacterales bacterium]
MKDYATKRKVLTEIITKYAKYAPENFVTEIKKQLTLRLNIPKDRLILEQPKQLELKNPNLQIVPQLGKPLQNLQEK